MDDSSHVHALLPPPTPTTKKSNKIRDIVRLQQMLKKWKKAASTTKNDSNTNSNSSSSNNNVGAGGGGGGGGGGGVATNNKATTKGLNKFLKKTLSFSDISSSNSNGAQEDVVKKGYLAVWVGRDEDEMKKFVIPTDYLAHQAFSVLLRDAEEEFGFQQEGILKIPCDVPLFEKILKMMSENKKQQRPTLKSSSSTSSFFLYEQDHHHHQQQQGLPNHISSPAPAQHHHRHNLHGSSAFDSQLTPPTTPTHNLPLSCR